MYEDLEFLSFFNFFLVLFNSKVFQKVLTNKVFEKVNAHNLDKERLPMFLAHEH